MVYAKRSGDLARRNVLPRTCYESITSASARASSKRVKMPETRFLTFLRSSFLTIARDRFYERETRNAMEDALARRRAVEREEEEEKEEMEEDGEEEEGGGEAARTYRGAATRCSQLLRATIIDARLFPPPPARSR